MRTLTIIAVLTALLLGLACQSHNPLIDHLSQSDRALIEVTKVKSAEQAFRLRFARYGTLDEIGPNGRKLMGEDLAGGSHWGYHFNLDLTDAGYSLMATPTEAGGASHKSYYCDETGVVRWALGPGPAAADSATIEVVR